MPGSVFGEDEDSLQQVGPAHSKRADSFGGSNHGPSSGWAVPSVRGAEGRRSGPRSGPRSRLAAHILLTHQVFGEVSQQQLSEAPGQRGLVGTCCSGAGEAARPVG